VQDIHQQSISAEVGGTAHSLPSRVSRRAFIAGAAAAAAMTPKFLRASLYGGADGALLHLATRASQSGQVHTFVLTREGCELLGSTDIASFSAFAAHPLLPVLYVARDCKQWENLPRGVVETYAVQRDAPPLRLLSRTPMALSATGPRSLAVAPCGRHLLVSASTGGAWNTFSLDDAGIPGSVAMSRKETGHVTSSGSIAFPAPQGLAFSPLGLWAVGTDPGSQHMSLLRPSSAEIAVLTRWETTHGIAHVAPVWTADGRYFIAANAQTASLSIYEVGAASGSESKAEVRLGGTVQTMTPIKALLAHPSEPAIFTSRPQGNGSRLELWKMNASGLRLATDTWISGDVVALAQHFDHLWAASNDRLIRISTRDFRDRRTFEVPLHRAQALIVQSAIAQPLSNI
jgi:hypothetical protein